MSSTVAGGNEWLVRAFELIDYARLSLLDNKGSQAHIIKKEIGRIHDLPTGKLISRYVAEKTFVPPFVLEDFLQELDTSAFASAPRSQILFSEGVPSLSEIKARVGINPSIPDRQQLYLVKSLFAKLIQEGVRENNDLIASEEQLRQPTVTEFEFDGEKIEAKPVRNAAVDPSTDAVRTETIQAQVQELDRLLSLIEQDQSVQVGVLQEVLRDYRSQLVEQNFIRADVIFQGIRHEEVRSLLFEIDQAWLELLTVNHSALRGFFPEYLTYMEAVLRGKESQIKVRQADNKLSAAVIRTPAGEELLAESVRKVVAEIEAQGDRAKAEWDSKGVAAKLEIVLKKLPMISSAGAAAEQLYQMVVKYLGGPPS